MLKKLPAKVLIIAISAMMSVQFALAQVSGTVYRDVNANGTRETTNPNEPGEFGIAVLAYNSNNALLASTATDANGFYSFSTAQIASGTAVRLEFVDNSGDFAAKRSAANSSNVQFVTAGAAATNVNYATASLGWYNNNTNPWVATNGATNGNPISSGAGSAGVNNNLYIFPYDCSGVGNTSTQRQPNSQLGSIFALTSQNETRTLLQAAYLKRHVGFGPNGIGAIYKSTISAAGVPTAANLLVDVSTIGINVGTNPRTVALPNLSIDRNEDLGVFAEVGKRGIGGMDLSDNGSDLYLVNMFEKKVHRINVGNPLKASFSSSDVTGNWTIPTPTNIGSAVWHPMGIKFWRGAVYVGGVTAQERTTAPTAALDDTANLRGIVFQLNPTNGSFTEVLRFPMSYRRGFSNSDYRYEFKNNYWRGWQNNGDANVLRNDINASYLPLTPNTGENTGIYYPQPMLSDIEFDIDGSMVIGIRDRFGDQSGYRNVFEANNPTAEPFFRGLTSGEMLRAGKQTNINAWTIENAASVTTNGVTSTSIGLAVNNTAASGSFSSLTGSPMGGNYGPGLTAGAASTNRGYYYYNHNFEADNVPAPFNTAGFLTSHYMKGVGGLAFLPGSNEVMMTTMDPLATAYTNGVTKHTNKAAGALTTGNMSARLELIVTDQATPSPANMGKSNGIGDLEIMTDAMPVEIGNRVWNDANGNGIQDANETGISGVAVTLRSPGANGTYGDGDDQTWSTTTDASGNYYFDNTIVNDNRKPAAWTGLTATNSGVLSGYEYRVEIGTAQTALTGYNNTKTDVSANGFERIDNDGVISGANLQFVVNPGGRTGANTTFGNNYNIDFGFTQLGSIGNRVWNDNGAGSGVANDGLQNGSELGVAGVTVQLFRNGADNTPGTADDVLVGATVTDAFGNYLFENLPAATNYNVQFTLPSNYKFTSANQGADDNIDSDANATTGNTGTITLASGQNRRDVDAGIVFNPLTASTLGSIGDQIWRDLNGNNVKDATDPGIGGVTVVLYDGSGNVVATTVTDANGNYKFTDLAAGNYRVGITLPAGTVLVTKDSGADDAVDSDINTTGTNFGKTDVIALTAGQNITNVDGGLRQDTKSSVGDRVWNDLDQDGVQDAGEPGIAGVTVRLYKSDGTLLQTTVTDAFGNYMFTGLDDNTRYYLEVVAPSGYTASPKDAGGNDNTDSDFSTTTNRTDVFQVLLGSPVVDTRYDAGFYQTTPAGTNRLGNKVWNDLNENGVQDANEPGVAGVTVTLYNSTGTAVGTTVTDANGEYQFVNLANGSYSVGFSNIPNGYRFTGKDLGANDNTDSDADGLGRTPLVSLTGSTSNQTLDAGIAQGVPAGKASIGDKVFYDLDSDGIQDAGELGVKNVRVELLNSAGTVIATTFTDALGKYAFTNLDAGNYSVRFSNFPVGATVSANDQGSNDDNDSDGLQTGAVTTSTTATIGLATGEEKTNIDLGIIPQANTNSVGDIVWFDNNKDGILNNGELGVPGVTVYLINSLGFIEDVTTTDENGNYLFVVLADGTYNVGFGNLPSGYRFTNPLLGGNTNTDSDADLINFKTAAVTLGPGNRAVRNLDGGIISDLATIGDRVWLDGNSDGLQTAGEPGIAGVLVTLFDGAGNAIASTVTDGNGNYLFTNVPYGTYSVGVSNFPSNLMFTTQETATSANGSDINPATGRTANFTVDGTTPGTTDYRRDIDAGLKPIATAAVGDFVWNDLNSNGIQDANEPGVAGVTATLYDAANNIVGTTITDGNGRYFFPNVAPGTGYYIIFSGKPANSSYTAANQGAGGATGTNNSRVNGAGQTPSFNLVANQILTNIDAGIISLNTLPARDITLSGVYNAGQASLQWNTVGEINVASHQIERSTDGSNFSTVATVNSRGNGNNSYNANDDLSNINSNVVYYRIKLVDRDGQFSYSRTIRLQLVSKVDVLVTPNPFVSNINLQINLSKSTNGFVSVVNALGQTVVNKPLSLTAGNHSLIISEMSNAAAGTYYVRVQMGDIVKTEKVIKQ
jgi:hypothetical protein